MRVTNKTQDTFQKNFPFYTSLCRPTLALNSIVTTIDKNDYLTNIQHDFHTTKVGPITKEY